MLQAQDMGIRQYTWIKLIMHNHVKLGIRYKDTDFEWQCNILKNFINIFIQISLYSYILELFYTISGSKILHLNSQYLTLLSLYTITRSNLIACK